MGTFPRVTHPSAAHPKGCARLACVKPAASVRSEPGSNSQVGKFIRLYLDRTFDEVSNTLSSRRAVRLQREPTSFVLTEGQEFRRTHEPSRKDHAVHVSLSSYSIVKEPEADQTSYVRHHPKARRTIWHVPSVSPNFVTSPEPEAPHPSRTGALRFSETRISPSDAVTAVVGAVPRLPRPVRQSSSRKKIPGLWETLTRSRMGRRNGPEFPRHSGGSPS